MVATSLVSGHVPQTLTDAVACETSSRSSRLLSSSVSCPTPARPHPQDPSNPPFPRGGEARLCSQAVIIQLSCHRSPRLRPASLGKPGFFGGDLGGRDASVPFHDRLCWLLDLRGIPDRNAPRPADCTAQTGTMYSVPIFKPDIQHHPSKPCASPEGHGRQVCSQQLSIRRRLCTAPTSDVWCRDIEKRSRAVGWNTAGGFSTRTPLAPWHP